MTLLIVGRSNLQQFFSSYLLAVATGMGVTRDGATEAVQDARRLWARREGPRSCWCEQRSGRLLEGLGFDGQHLAFFTDRGCGWDRSWRG